ncbi:hypothetical protein D3870_12015 [Noviherbaspirillum cavernae]|uniref:Uncharacterized protein n=1 Tax=Noviherbaspirillum cavernae TaxID=2320862 RepID=A0A418X2N5_9BURK|nr:hypothetical protein [Noviherbaspirillum cavernae]RJG06641.1 hypothetical protein D3870_12015 [Noviherbaspirillum cavernae]
MKKQGRPSPSPDKGQEAGGATPASQLEQQSAGIGPEPHGFFAGKPLDGSQYLEVIEEQEYAEQRPTAAEQKPRYSFLNPPPQPGRKR